MSYQAKRKKLYEEEFQLIDENGNVVHTINVSLDADNMVKKLSEKHLALTKALKDVQHMEESGKGLEILGSTIVDIIEAVFGKEDAKVVLEFYDNRYVEMCQEVVPFITTIVIPAVRKIAKENKLQVLSQYNKKPKRLFGRR